MKLFCSRMPSENPCSQGFSNAPCGGTDIASIVRAVNTVAAQSGEGED